MGLAPGVRLGEYQIVALAGQGAMGEVYRARDDRLKRDVAIKVLPAQFAHDPERVARFQREAEALASLNQSNIAVIYDLDQIDDLRFLILEFVEGETLAERLVRGPLPWNEASNIARQICDALSSAHDRGIVHRDLKPANIKITSEGKVKLLDFGLARLFASDASVDLSNSPTMMSESLSGSIIGTVAYMAPEQARGKPADKRTDVWAVGCILYEMLTGRQLFGGETLADTLAAVVTKDPDWTQLPAAPAHIGWLLRQCLQKDPALRFRDAADASALLGSTHEERVVGARPRRWIVHAVYGAGFLTVLALTAHYLRIQQPAKPPIRFDVSVQAPVTQTMALSPDGLRFVYYADSGAGKNVLWLRSLDELEAKILPGTEGAGGSSNAFWSPDSRFVALAVGRTLKKSNVNGGVAEAIMSLDSLFGGGSWNRNDDLLVATNNHGIRRIASGGDVSDVTQRDTSLEETYHDCPSFLPDGQHFLYLAYSVSKPQNRALYVAELGAKGRTRLMPLDSCAVYSAGFILFPRDKVVMARPFMVDRLRFTGDAVPLIQDVIRFPEYAAFAVSDERTLIYRKQMARSATRRLVWMDRSGKASPPIGPAVEAMRIRLSPDGKRVLFSEGVDGGSDDIWIYDLDRDVKLRLTTDPALDHNPVWSPDGSRIVFDSHRPDDATLYEMPASGAVVEHVLLPPERGIQQAPYDWSLDGRMIVVQKGGASSKWDLWVLPLLGDRKPFPYVVSPFNKTLPALSPNGRWLAYTSDESGKSQVVVQPFPDPSSGKWQVSADGGAYPRWRRDGREIYYITSAGDMVAVAVSTSGRFEIGKSTTLFRTPFTLSATPRPYDVTADGQRFLMSIPVSAANSPPVTVVLNWPSTLKP